MTAINENGQVYFTFDDLDFDGALDDVLLRVLCIKDLLDKENTFDSVLIGRFEKRIDLLLKISVYLDRLKKGQKYV